MKTRIVIQIAAATEGENREMTNVIIALCDDGTLWELAYYLGEREWKKIPGPPGT